MTEWTVSEGLLHGAQTQVGGVAVPVSAAERPDSAARAPPIVLGLFSAGLHGSTSGVERP